MRYEQRVQIQKLAADTNLPLAVGAGIGAHEGTILGTAAAPFTALLAYWLSKEKNKLRNAMLTGGMTVAGGTALGAGAGAVLGNEIKKSM